jgi:hypothetical protein
MDSGLRRIVTARLDADGAAGGEWGALVLGALDGRDALEAHLAGRSAAPRASAAAAAPPPLGGAFLRAIEVEGFRGVGRAQTLELAPGPGLTLVVGRNGSGKSSFAEAIETLLTGDSLRWRTVPPCGATAGATSTIPRPRSARRSWSKARRSRASSRAAGTRARRSRWPR